MQWEVWCQSLRKATASPLPHQSTAQGGIFDLPFPPGLYGNKSSMWLQDWMRFGSHQVSFSCICGFPCKESSPLTVLSVSVPVAKLRIPKQESFAGTCDKSFHAETSSKDKAWFQSWKVVRLPGVGNEKPSFRLTYHGPLSDFVRWAGRIPLEMRSQASVPRWWPALHCTEPSQKQGLGSASALPLETLGVFPPSATSFKRQGLCNTGQPEMWHEFIMQTWRRSQSLHRA